MPIARGPQHFLHAQYAVTSIHTTRGDRTARATDAGTEGAASIFSTVAVSDATTCLASAGDTAATAGAPASASCISSVGEVSGAGATSAWRVGGWYEASATSASASTGARTTAPSSGRPSLPGGAGGVWTAPTKLTDRMQQARSRTPRKSRRRGACVRLATNPFIAVSAQKPAHSRAGRPIFKLRLV